ncbi:hypothetical protein [Sphingopyxis macrogoltabida]|uniref:hypothetical protein n=1 Tax=Sphingopyxis macrogoltabida TaxID=33050 RepID=UPI0011AB7631|nr:hypothetical protein [Sphingopyxis macrogoltabida]
MSILLLALLAAEPIDCPPAGSAARDRLTRAGEICRDDKERLDKLAAENRNFQQRGIAFKDRPLPATLQGQIRALMDRYLRDEPATRYRWPAWKHPDLYCFEANGKNAFGAYAGWETYAVSITKGRVSELADSSECDGLR